MLTTCHSIQLVSSTILSACFLLFAGSTVLLLFPFISVYAQDEWQNLELDWLQEVMPLANSFSAKQGTPAVIRAYRPAAETSDPELVGYIFTTPDLPPEEAGFSGPVDLLIGMDLQGIITGVKVLYYQESYKFFRGDFIEESGFPDLFTGKSVAQNFRVGADIDGMASATITSWAMARGLRNAARAVAEAYLTDSPYVSVASVEQSALQALQDLTWPELVADGFVRELSVPIDDEAELQFAIAYMGHYRLGEMLVGATAYSNADRTASGMVQDGHMLLLGLSGKTSRLEQLRLGAIQGGQLYPNREDRVVFAGTANEGKIAGHAGMAIAMFLDPAIDITQSFTFVYDTGTRRGEFEDYIGVDYSLTPAALSLIRGSTASDQMESISPVDLSSKRFLIPALGLFAALLLFLNSGRITRQGEK